jgi:hypothetical protein
MKKLIGILALILITGISCEKEEKLSGSVPGDWTSAALLLGEAPVYFKATFSDDGKSLLSAYNAENSALILALGEANYSVNDAEIQITIDEPDFEQQSPANPDQVTFYVFMSSAGDQMVWFPKIDDEDTPRIDWTRD